MTSRVRPAKCGTDGGYFRHLRTTKTEPCEACRQAHSDYERRRQAARNGHESARCERCGESSSVPVCRDCKATLAQAERARIAAEDDRKRREASAKRKARRQLRWERDGLIWRAEERAS